jgi:hypothetical protein
LGINCSSFRTAREKSEPGQTSGTSRKSSFGIKGGASLSSFRNEESKIGEGLVLALWKEWRLAERIALAGEILLVRKMTIIENKSVLPEYPVWLFPPYSDNVYYYDIECSIDHIDIPILLKYEVPFYKSLGLQFIGGLGLSLGFHNRSRLKLLYSLPKPDDGGAEQWDYVTVGDDMELISIASGFNINVGIGLKKSIVALECRLMLDLCETENAGRVRINKKYQTLLFLLSFSI